MRRVVVSGMGIISCLGNDLDQVAQALCEGRSGLAWQPEYASRGMRSCVAGVPDISGELPLSRKIRRFMGDASLYAYLAARHALINPDFDTTQKNPFHNQCAKCGALICATTFRFF